MASTTIFTPSDDLEVGNIVCRAGDVTQLNYLINVAPAELETRLGYEAGRLRPGWYLLLLEQSVAAGEFTWGGTTESSGGTDPKRVETFQGQEYRIPVQDLKRFDLYNKSGFDEAKVETTLNTFLARELQLLNDRASHDRIAKVVPIIGHDDEKFWLTQYPDAAAGHGVKQWTLHKKAKKKFRVGAKVPAGHKYLGGGRVGIGSAA
jgi:hypothetical protein